MSNNNKPNNFFGESSNFDPDKITFEIPSEQKPTYHERIPSAYDPMGEIYLRGRAMRNMSSGTIPWWVLLSGWVLFGGLYLLLLCTAISLTIYALIPSLIIFGIPLLILLRGTLAKLSTRKLRRR